MKPFGIIGQRLLFWFAVVAIVPLVIVGVRGYSLARRAVILEVFQHMESVAGQRRTYIEYWLKDRISDLNVLAFDPRIQSYLLSSGLPSSNTSHAMTLFRSWLDNADNFDRIGLLDSDGNPQIQCSPSDDTLKNELASVNSADWPSWNSEIGAFRLSPVGYDSFIGTWISLARKLVDQKGRNAGWLVARLPLSRSLDALLMDSTGLGQTGHVYLVDEDNLMLTRSRLVSHPAPGTHYMSSSAIDSALSGSSGVGTYATWDGHPVLGAWYYIPPAGWALIAEMDRNEALAPLSKLKHNWLMVSILTLIAVFVVVALIARSLSSPILRLSGVAQKISEGDLSVRTGIDRKDEVGALAQAFDQMGEALTASRRSLEQSYQHLVQTERRLVQSEKLASIGELVASIVHELRNPLSAVKMNLKMLARKQIPDLAIAESIEIAQVQVLKLERMLSQILDYAKPLEPRMAPVDLAGVISEAVESFRESIESQGTMIQMDLTPEHQIVCCDRDLIMRALTNVIGNALEAMSGRDTRQLKLTATPGEAVEGNIVLEFSDTGKGMSENQLERIFEPFYTTRQDGTGLGLPNARKVIELHRGRLEVFSREGAGTTVRITLPIRGDDV